MSGVSGAGLAASSGAYNVPNTSGRPFLMKLDPTGSKLVFTATGIGGNALALDSSGDIYMAGSTVYTDYPTTPGAYQSVLNSVTSVTEYARLICPAPINMSPRWTRPDRN